MSGWFDGWRHDGGPTLYAPNKTPVTVDVLEAGLFFAIAILAFSFLLIIPGIRGKERISSSIRVFVSLFIGACIILCNFGQEWEVGHLHTKTQYKAGIAQEVTANIGMKIGLRSINITLKGDPERQTVDNNVTERINYNERFHWSNPWGQGRRGFSQYAGQVNQEYRAANYKGLPYPILWIAEYFVFDGEGIRWGRFYRWSGFYTHIMIWLAFPLWIIANILFFMVIRYGSYLLGMTGGCLVIANIVYATVRNPTALVVPFEDGILRLAWGWCFWLNLINGILCLLVALAIFLMDLLAPDKIADFFGIDPLQDYEEYYIDKADESQDKAHRKMSAIKQRSHENERQRLESDLESNGDRNISHNSQDLEVHFRKRGPTRKVTKKSIKLPRKPRPMPRGNANEGLEAGSIDVSITEDDGPTEDYENVAVFARHQQSQQPKSPVDSDNNLYLEVRGSQPS